MEKIDTDQLHIDLEQLSTFRKTLHQFPEVSGEEHETQKRVKAFLQELQPDVLQEIGNTGLVCVFKGETAGPRLLFRAELDALPIQEINDFAHKSKNKGIGHKCGHDGHTTIICGLAQQLSKQKPPKGEVVLLFQPAEEIGMGALEILHDKAFSQFKPDRVFALHNIPGLPMGKVVLRKGPFTAAVKSLVLRITGKTSHAAEPENGINPAYFIAEVLQQSFNLIEADINSEHFALVTPTHGMFGDENAYGTSAGYGELRLTVRTWSNDVMEEMAKCLLNIAKQSSSTHKVEIETEWTQEFAANRNSHQAIDMLERICQNQNIPFEYRQTPFKWGEDFGHFTKQFDGAMFGLGSGEDQPALHNPDYDFPDELITRGVTLFYQIIRNYLH